MISINDIPKFTSWGNYSVHIQWAYLAEQLANYAENNVQLDPDFQRGHVWSTEQQAAYIEFCLKGGKSGRDILFNNPNWTHIRNNSYNDFVLVDGLQRITAVTKFMNNELAVFNGNLLQDFTCTIGDIRRQVLRGQRFTVYINDLQSKKEVLQWYLDLNSGGVVHSPEELSRVKEMLTNDLSN
jgi:uncharacterized protein with ParB-like and HNH nuclease domain